MVGDSPVVGDELDDGVDRSLDTVFHLLGDRRRRHVLACLAESEGELTLTELAEEVAAREGQASPGEVPDEDCRSVRLALHHNHVPRLAASGALEYDRDRGLVRESTTTGRLERVRSLLADGGEGRP